MPADPDATRSTRSIFSGATANDRFKRGFASRFWLGVIAATLAHAALVIISPTFATDAYGETARLMDVVSLPDRIEVPPPPDEVQRPAAPVSAEVDVTSDLTIPRTTLDSNPPKLLPPPPDRAEPDSMSFFTPMTIRPVLRNEAEIARALVRLYPPVLRDSGLGGRVLVWVFVDVEGRVVRAQVRESSGYEAFDTAALKAAEQMRFSPAYNRDQKVAVWVSVPVTFESRS